MTRNKRQQAEAVKRLVDNGSTLANAVQQVGDITESTVRRHFPGIAHVRSGGGTDEGNDRGGASSDVLCHIERSATPGRTEGVSPSDDLLPDVEEALERLSALDPSLGGDEDDPAAVAVVYSFVAAREHDDHIPEDNYHFALNNFVFTDAGDPPSGLTTEHPEHRVACAVITLAKRDLDRWRQTREHVAQWMEEDDDHEFVSKQDRQRQLTHCDGRIVGLEDVLYNALAAVRPT